MFQCRLTRRSNPRADMKRRDKTSYRKKRRQKNGEKEGKGGEQTTQRNVVTHFIPTASFQNGSRAWPRPPLFLDSLHFASSVPDSDIRWHIPLEFHFLCVSAETFPSAGCKINLCGVEREKKTLNVSNRCQDTCQPPTTRCTVATRFPVSYQR